MGDPDGSDARPGRRGIVRDQGRKPAPRSHTGAGAGAGCRRPRHRVPRRFATRPAGAARCSASPGTDHSDASQPQHLPPGPRKQTRKRSGGVLDMAWTLASCADRTPSAAGPCAHALKQRCQVERSQGRQTEKDPGRSLGLVETCCRALTPAEHPQRRSSP
jgi:hypothetical protein